MRDLEELKSEKNLKDYAERNLKKSKGGFYCCPACGSGTHGKGTGALSIDSSKPFLFKCFACGLGGTVIDLIKAVECMNTKDAVKRLRELYDPDYNENWMSGKTDVQTDKKEVGNTMEAKQEQAYDVQYDVKMNFLNYYVRCQNRIGSTNYPLKRGLEENTVKRFGLGYDPEWVSPKVRYVVRQENRKIEKENKKRKEAGQPLLPLKRLPQPSPRLIIPLSENNYLARDTRPDESLTDAQKEFKKQNCGKDKPFFNLDAIENPLCFFVVEGEIDALSIEQAGGSCVGLGTANRAKAFGKELVEWAKKRREKKLRIGTVIIALDNDNAGVYAADQIEDACMIAGIDFLHFNLSGSYKDPNDFLVNDKQRFYNEVNSIIETVRKETMKNFAKGYTAHGADAFMRRMTYPALETGFKNLDKFLGGGITSNGLVFIGGLSSIGKTTFVLQLSDYIATNRYPKGSQDVIRGKDVLYFALEQSEEDLLSKIYSRRLYLEIQAPELAKTNWQLMQEDKQGWSQKTWETLWGCHVNFKQNTGGNLRIIESPGRLSVLDVVRYTKEHISITGRVPIIVIDYLQILKPISDKLTDKQAIDATIVLLKQLSRDYKTCVIGISSFNRQNYWQPVNMSAFKESGNLEYSADLLLAVAPAGMKDTTDEGDKEDKIKAENKRIVDNCKEAEVKKIQLHVLKNRNGRITGRKNKLLFTYHAKYNYFEEVKPESYLHYFDNGNPQATGKKRVTI